uniref:Growth arrest-specific 1a n=1 Tax=Haemonchus contortus TaxID=6289 RepID=A0A7I4Y1N8_HAECO
NYATLTSILFCYLLDSQRSVVMILLHLHPLFLCGLLYLTAAQEPNATAECKSALEACENDLECSNRLAPLMAACTTNTCQPQCRNAVLNVYQNKLGRTLLRSDASCIPGREELKQCHFLPAAPLVHCSLAKLACEADLQCNSKWGVFISECEAESARGECSERCYGLLAETVATPHGQAFESCTCTEREDQLCIHLKDNILDACNKPTPSPPAPGDNSITSLPTDFSSHGHGHVSSTTISSPCLLLCAMFLIQLFYSVF